MASYRQDSGPSGTTTSRGSAVDREFSRVADIIGWTRWAGGTVNTAFESGASGTTTYGVNGGGHILWGSRATNLPTTGEAIYDLVGSTAVTLSTETVTGTVDTASLKVMFSGAPKIGIDLGIRINNSDYLVSSIGGIAAPAINLDLATMAFAGDGQVSNGNGCTAATCGARFNGFLAGNGASHAGVHFNFSTAPGRGQPAAVGVVTFGKRP